MMTRWFLYCTYLYGMESKYGFNRISEILAYSLVIIICMKEELIS